MNDALSKTLGGLLARVDWLKMYQGTDGTYYIELRTLGTGERSDGYWVCFDADTLEHVLRKADGGTS